MDKIHSIRQLYYEQGKTIPEIITETGHDRKTITKYLDMTDFNAPEPVTPDPEGICPKLEPYKSLIDTWLMEDKKVPRKQRHTARRVYRRLGKEADGFDCSYRLVAQYVAFRKSQMHLDNKKGYLPLVHHPGEGQADFGTARFYENSFCREGKYLVLSFPHSNGGYCQLMYGENTECFMESMIAIFEHIGGVPTELWFDNTSTIVTKILKDGGRQLTDRFLRFSEHYGFRYRFMNPESGWEKGSVENKVGYVRRNFLVPPPRFTSLADFNKELLEEADRDVEREHYHYDQTIRERYEEDRRAFLPLPDIAFDSARYMAVLTDKWGRFTLESGRHEYSVSPEYTCVNVWLKITATQVKVMDMQHHPVVTHQRLYGEQKQSSMNWLPYLRSISKKPRSLFHSGIFDMMPENMKQYMRTCSSADRGSILKVLAELTDRTGFDSALQTINQALLYQVTDPDSLKNLYRRLYSDVPEMPPFPQQSGIPNVAQMPADLSAYDRLLKKGGAVNG